MTPENIASNLQSLIKLSKDILVAKIPEYIEEKKKAITKLDGEIKLLKENKEGLEIETSAVRGLHNAATEDEKITVIMLTEYLNLKAELKMYGLSIEEDIPKLVQIVHGIKRYEYDINKVLSDYSDQEFKQIKSDLLGDQVKRLEDTKIGLHNECSFIKEQIGLQRQRLYICQELKSVGLGLNELRHLRNTIKEMAAEKGIIYKDAIREFFESLEKQYDIKFRLKKINHNYKFYSYVKLY